jgi:hypothetical protein
MAAFLAKILTTAGRVWSWYFCQSSDKGGLAALASPKNNEGKNVCGAVGERALAGIRFFAMGSWT